MEENIDFSSIHDDDRLIRYLGILSKEPFVLTNQSLFSHIKGLLSINKGHFKEVRKEVQQLLNTWWPHRFTSVANNDLSITQFLRKKRSEDSSFISEMKDMIPFQQKVLFWKAVWMKDEELIKKDIESAFGWMMERTEGTRLMGAIQNLSNVLIQLINQLESLPSTDPLCNQFKEEKHLLKEKYLQEKIPLLSLEGDDFSTRWKSLKQVIAEIDKIYESIKMGEETIQKNQIKAIRLKPIVYPSHDLNCNNSTLSSSSASNMLMDVD